MISQKSHNYNYAPGLTTYALDGILGLKGESGNNIFYTDYNITDDELLNFIAQIKNEKLPIKGSTVSIERSYQDGDLFFTSDGYIHLLKNFNAIQTTTSYDICFNKVGKIDIKNDNIIRENNRLTVDPSNYNGLSIYLNATNSAVSNAALSIMSSKLDSDNNINFVSMNPILAGTANTGLNIKFDTNTLSYLITADKPIVIDSDVKINKMSDVEMDDYSNVLTSNDTITKFHNFAELFNYSTYKQSGNLYVSIFPADQTLSPEQKTLKLNELNNYTDQIYVKAYNSSGECYLSQVNKAIETTNNYISFAATTSSSINSSAKLLDPLDKLVPTGNPSLDGSTLNMKCCVNPNNDKTIWEYTINHTLNSSTTNITKFIDIPKITIAQTYHTDVFVYDKNSTSLNTVVNYILTNYTRNAAAPTLSGVNTLILHHTKYAISTKIFYTPSYQWIGSGGTIQRIDTSICIANITTPISKKYVNILASKDTSALKLLLYMTDYDSTVFNTESLTFLMPSGIGTINKVSLLHNVEIFLKKY